jgi:SAM-dependent methyltransferase
MDPFSFYYDQEYAHYYKSMDAFLDKRVDFKDKEVLCLACGTGHFQKRYIDNGAKSVTCLDISKNFLDIFRDKIANRPEYREKISLIRDDMSKFDFKKKFDLILLLGNSFCYLKTQKEQLACLSRIRGHLKEGGRAYVDILPLSDRINSDFRLKRSFTDRNGQLVNEAARGRLYYPQHRLDFEIQWRSKAGVFKSTVTTRLITTPEMSLLLTLAGLKVTTIYYDYSRKINKGASTWIYDVKK